MGIVEDVEPTSEICLRRAPTRERAILLAQKHWVALAVAVLAVLLMRLNTPVARPMNDGVEYLKVASVGLQPQAQLGAPFVYRLAVPLFVHGITLATGFDPGDIFSVIVPVTCVLLLIAVYTVALASGATRGQALFPLLVVALSFFMIRFPLYAVYCVDVEAVTVSCVAFLCLLRSRYIPALAVSLVGLLFKEFLLIPLFALVGTFLAQYVRERTVVPLRWAVLSLVLMLLMFLLPRLLIPVTYGSGTFVVLKAPQPSQTFYLSELRTLLAWPPRAGTAINMLLALASFWLPALILVSRRRFQALREMLGPSRFIVILWMASDLLLMAIGGTNVMIFVTYMAPVLVLVLILLVRAGAEKWEIAFALVATMVFNRMIFAYGAPGGELDLELGFYGAYWHKITAVTAWRFAEVSGWILTGWVLRQLFLVRRSRIRTP